MSDWFDRFCLGVAILFSVLGFGLMLKSISVSGQADFCYLYMKDTYGPVQYVLEAHRPWREDKIIGVYNSILEPVAIAAGMECPLFTKRPGLSEVLPQKDPTVLAQ